LILYFFLFSLILSFLLCSIQSLKAQDAHFSQFFAAPLYINPAFAGATPQGRFTTSYRAQWTRLPGEFVTYQVAYDQSFEQYKSSIGFTANLDKAGSASIQSTNFNLMYAYTLQIQKETALKAGFQIGYGSRTLDYYKLVFGDQLTEIGSKGSPSAEQGLENLNINYFDVGAGFVLFAENFWLGVSGHHLNQPNHSITEIPEKLDMKISIQTGYKFIKYGSGKNRRDGYSMALNPGIYYSQQGNYKQLDIGANGFIDPIVLGLWYRGVPIQKSYNGALVAVAGFKYRDFSFLYSYDLALGKFATVTGGAHEFSLAIKVGDKETKKKYKRKGGLPAFPSLIY
jgi:type IX secretion system PorP/SprF family membrane protein